ncbi:putative DNA helicase chromatin remodeling SNF2 family [Rosa chinensis]|uniref:Putative DNA helicase chromatin remodeling SNF2 family n=1 Tax=Rosa chinensis TaxID=74649 RepID=A0A2P6PV52_ROSCH|nr:protein CHROMATIN REMODELING 8 [Rosa chinensis]XP_024167828.1 protein CHROMATIN REMODELING 8 [Rosa chinensis]XP_024167829.1 protein CHROMATIN REMODELING 8 [Rosa chinensis]XP_024167830.1 protein CHROMATIN REMODELING 8 [Rosa chinensis]PRQ25810.1 putative DNA helicase chromatin remodeling SNF2 family [Rosa chinensis]
MEEDEDRILLSSLGVTSANPEDIERHILSEVKNNGNAGDIGEAGGSNEEEELGEKPESVDPSVASHAKLYNKLRAVEFEIDAVASTVEHEQGGNEDGIRDGDDGEERGDKEDDVEASDNLQHALATDRLRSLKKTKAQLEKELSDLGKQRPSKGIELDRVLSNIVKEKPAPKRKLKQVQKSGKKQEKRVKTVSFDEDDDFDAVLDAASTGFVETERDELVRKGILTPFHKLKGFERRLQDGGPSQRHNDPAEEDRNDDLFSASVARAAQSISKAAQARPTTKLLDSEALPRLEAATYSFQRLRKPLKIPQSLENDTQKNKKSGTRRKRPLPEKRWRNRISLEEMNLNGNEVSTPREEENQEDTGDIDDDEYPHVTLEGGLKIPEYIFEQLFDYQKVGVQWLWELHCQKAGGIIGDEMGLGKTIQVLSFLGALHFSRMYKPSIIVCPVTLLRQWRREAKKWYPSFHVELLHDSAQDSSNRKKQYKSSGSDSDSEGSLDSDYERPVSSKGARKWDALINRVLRSESGLLITTYEQLRIVGEKLLDVDWGYAVLDEGHRIRNPNAEITLVCKQLQTVHRIIMTGAPIQNKLTELWSLFDFVFPGKLGVLPIFEAEFAVPISVGGYANASPLQVSTAYRCAVVLRDLIMPYLLRRMKADVNAHLPKKTEHVIFCSLTTEQRSAYRAFLASSDVEQILDGNRNSLYGIDVMRKICNHPDLLEREHAGQNPDYGNPERSGKMKVIAQVLKAWKEQGHRVLLFMQTQQMLDIIESFLVAGEYSYRRMDGLTAIKHRMALIDEFNNSNDVFIFILTTKVGGLGTNLTGANRVLIFDPDWNPSTDMQARERAWRIGQKRDVTIYRLITRGTIEEKVYHRQIYKHFLTNKILKNPQQRRFFKARDMKDLFILNDEGDSGATETANIFGQLSEDANVVCAQKDDHSTRESKKVTVPYTNASAGKRRNSEIESSRRNGKEKADHSEGDVDEETNILKCLFDTQGIHSAMNHDVIMNAHDEEKMRLEEQASQVAQRAAEALRQSRMLRSRDSVSVPTWTGKSGMAGAPSAVRGKFGSTVNSRLISNTKPSAEVSNSRTNGFVAGASAGKALSSAELLARIRGNQEKAVEAGIEQQFGMASSSSSRGKAVDAGPSRQSQNLGGVPPEVLIRKICTFLRERGGSTNSATIVQHFKDRIPSKDLPLFKNLLKEIAKLEKTPSGSVWVLKPEFHQQ